MKKKFYSPMILCSFACLTAFGQTQFCTYTGISGFYDYQANYRTPQFIRACPSTSYIHAIMMVADDSLNPSLSRRTAYAFSSNGGTTWTTFSDIRVPARRSGFPSLDISQGAFANAAIVTNHSTIGTGLQSTIFVDYPVGSGAFSEVNAPSLLGSDEPIFPEIAGAADGSVILIASRAAGTTTHRTRTADFSTWQPWNVVTLDFISDGYVAEGNSTGRVGIAIATPGGPLQWSESTNNGQTWPATLTELLPENIPAGSDTFVITPGFDLVYAGSDTLVSFGVTKLINGNPTHRFSGIGFYSESTGFVLAVPHDSVSGAIDTLRKRQVNQYPVGYPAIGISGSNIVIAFQAYRADTSQAGFNYADVFFTHSSNGGRNWSRPRNLSNTQTLDERYVSVSKWNAAGEANIVYQEDPQPGSAVFGSDLSPLARTRQRYCRLSGFWTSVEELKENPVEFHLHQNYPNPFNPSTTIKFQMPNASLVRLAVFDLLGREVATLVNEEMKPGTYNAQWDANRFSSGVYLYRLQTATGITTRKMILIQ